MYATLALPESRPNCPIHSAAALRKAMQAKTERIALNAAGLDRVLRYDAARDLVEVQAGTPWSTLARHLEQQNPALRVYRPDNLLPSTVGDWIAQNGPALDGRPAVGFVEALTLVTPDGELRRVSREANSELFACAIGGHGIFGIAYSATLRVKELQSAAAAGALDDGGESFDEIARPGSRSPLNLLVCPDLADDLVTVAYALCQDWRLELRLRRIVRAQRENETRLRWATKDFAWVSLDIAAPRTLGAQVRVGQAKSALIDAAIRLGGSYAIAGTPGASRAQAETCYPGLRDFLAEKRRYDPGERLQNAWYRHHQKLFSRAHCNVSWN